MGLTEIFALLDPIFSWLAPLLTSKKFAYIYCFAILSIFICCIVLLLRQGLKLRKHIVDAKKYLSPTCDSEKTESDSHSAKEQKEHRFYDHFDSISEGILKNPVFQHNWSEFCESLIYPTSSDEPAHIKNSHSAGAFFNETNILLPYYSGHAYAAWPNYFTGLGILGTFLGLAAGIYLASAGLSSSIGTANTEGLKLSLQNLLSGAGLAFGTSIVGLSCSILFSFIEKNVYNGLKVSLSQWTNELDACVRRITAEDVGRQQLAIQEEQRDLMQEFVNTVGQNIENALNNMFTEGMQPLMREMVDGISLLRQERSTDSTNVITQAIADFAEQLQGAAGKEMAALGTSLGEMQATLVPLLQECRETQRVSMQSTQALSTVADKLSMLHSSIEQSIEHMLSGATTFEQAAQKTSEALQQSVEHSTATLQGIQEYHQKIEDASERQEKRFEQHLLAMQEQYGDFETTWGQAIQAAEQQRASLNAAWTQYLDSAQNHHSALELHHTSLAQKWDKYCERFEGVDAALVNTFKEIDSGLNSYGQVTKEYVGELDRHLGDATAHLNGVVRGLKEMVEEWGDWFESWKELAEQPQARSLEQTETPEQVA